jgi:hypothetical protein
LDDVTDDVGDKADPQDDENQGKNTSVWAELTNLTESDRGKSDHRHVKRIQHRPTLDQHISCCTDGDQDGGDQNGYDEVGCAIQNVIRMCSKKFPAIYLVPIHGFIKGTGKFPIQKWAIFYKFKKIGGIARGCTRLRRTSNSAD